MTRRYAITMCLWLACIAANAQQNFLRQYKPLEANNIEAWFSNDAINFQRESLFAAFIYPAKSGRSAIFIAGPWVAARFNADTSVEGLRTAAFQNIGSMGTEYMPGKIRVVGEDSLRSEFSFPRHRLYHLRRGDNAQTNPDFRDFPREDGAPVDLFGNPRIIGGETMWYTANDVAGFRRFSPKPLGCELQQTMYAIPSDNPVLNNAIFIRKRFINRNPKIPSNPNSGLWKDAFFGFFSDTDLGDALDDLGGCDSISKMMFAYNANENDPVYGSPPPAVGIMFLEGKRNQQPIDIYAISRGFKSGPMGDPAAPNASDIYNLLRGLNRNGSPAPFTQNGSRFMFPGDPESGVGILDTLAMDIRHWISAGPVDVAPGDTVEILYAVMVAQGATRRNSVTVLKNRASALREMHRVAAPPTKMWLYVNRGNDITSGKPFQIVVEARDENDFPRPVSQLTAIDVQLAQGNGSLSGNLSGVILPGQNSVTLNPTYQAASSSDTIALRAVRVTGNMLATSLSRPIPVGQRATSVALSALSSETNARLFALDTLQLKVRCARPDGTTDRSYFGTMRVHQIDGSGFIAGDSVARAYSGEATFRIAFRQGGWSKLRVTGDDVQALETDTIRIERPLTILKYPKFYFRDRLMTFPALLALRGLLPNAIYRYRVVASGNAATMIAPSEVAFLRVSPPFAPNVSTQFAQFKTDSEGNYRGWFIAEMNERSFFRIQLNDGRNGEDIILPDANNQLFSSRLILEGLRTTTGLIGLRATNLIGALPLRLDTMDLRRKIVALYETNGASQQPLAMSIIEDDLLDATPLPSFYQDSVNARNGRFGAIVPQNLINAIRRVEIYDLQGRLRASATSPDGLWNNGLTMSANGLYRLQISASQFIIEALPNNEPQTPRPTAFQLGQNYPNPFNPTTVIPIQIPRTERVSLKVFDVLGREVATLVSETLAPNEYLIPFNAANLSSGIYFYRLQAGDFLETKKMILLK